MHRATRFCSRNSSRGHLESSRAQELIQILSDPLIEPVELRLLLWRQFSVACKRMQETSGQWSVNAFEQFEEHEANPVTLRQQAIPARFGNSLDQAFGAQLGEIVAKRTQAILTGFAV